MKQKNVIDVALAGRLQRMEEEYARSMNVLLVRIGDLEDALKRIYLGSGVGIQSARAIARKALYGDSEA